MKGIISLLLADLKRKNSSFKIIAALMMIITFSFSGTVSNNDNLEKALKESFENTGVGDLLITLKEENYTDEIISALEENHDVKEFRADELIAVNSAVELNGNKQDMIVRLAKADDRLRIMNDDISGFDENAKVNDGEVYISYSLAKMTNIEKGSEFTVKTSYGDEIFKVAGFVEDPIYGSSTLAAKKFFISEGDYQRIISEKTDGKDALCKNLEIVYMVHVMKNGDISEKELSSNLNEQCGIIDIAELYITKDVLADAIKVYSSTGSKILAVFTVLLTAIVIITIHNNISSSVEMDYVDLGVLKSQGFTSGQIRAVYIIKYTIALFTGTVLGILLLIPVIKVLGKLFIIFTCIITHGESSVLKCFSMSAVICAVCILSAVISTMKISRISPVNALRGGKNDVYFSSRLNIPIKKKPLSLFIALRQITSKPSAYFGTAFITAILVFFMISVGVMIKGISTDSIFGDMEKIRTGMILFENFSTDDMDRIRDAVCEENENAEVFFNAQSDNIYLDGIIYDLDVTDNIELRFKMYDGRTPVYDNEIAITDIVEGETGKHVGDTVSVHNDNGTFEYLITGIYQDPTNFGKVFAMNFEAAEKLGISPKNAFIKIDECTEEENAEMTDMLNDRFSDILIADKYEIDSSTKGLIDIMDFMLDILVAVIYSISCVFGLLVVAMLSKRALLREQHDIGIYKAEGFSVNLLRFQFSCRFFVIAVIGSLIGIVPALLFTRSMFSALLRSLGITDFISDVDIVTVFAPVIAISVCFLAFTYIVAWKVKKVEVRELITE